MSRYDPRFAERFLAVSRVTLGLAPAADPLATRPAYDSSACRTLLDSDVRCPIEALRLTEDQRDELIEVLRTHVPAIRSRMKAARRARNETHKRALRDVGSSPLRSLVDEAHACAEIARLRAGAMRDLRRVLTPYQRVRLDLGRAPRGFAV
jgi:Spy/CpxP family protein refolding chaperone